MTKRLTAILLAVLLLFCFCGCGDDADTPLKESDYLPPHTPALDTAITTMLSAADVSAIIGTAMTAIDAYEDGTMAQYLSADGTKQVLVNMKNTTAALFDVDMAELPTGEAISSLGTKAYWYAETGEIICFHNGYSIAVNVIDPSVNNTKGLCEALVGKIIINLK